MGFFARLSRLLRANLNDLVSKAEDPVKILDQSVADMQADLVKLRQAVAIAISSQKRLRNQAEQSESQVKTWYSRAELALQKGVDLATVVGRFGRVEGVGQPVRRGRRRRRD